MEHLLLLRSETKKVFLQRKTWFLIFSVLVACLSVWLCGFDSSIQIPAFCCSLLTVFCLGSIFAYVHIDSITVRIGWGFICYALFVAVAFLLIDKQPYGNLYGISLIGGAVTWMLVYVFSPFISYKLKLNERKYGYSLDGNKYKFNNCILFFVISAIYLIFVFMYQREQKLDYLINQEEWTPVQSWSTEIMSGNIYYIVNCSKGILRISPLEYPDIRFIGNNTQIKCISANNSELSTPIRLKIKN